MRIRKIQAETLEKALGEVKRQMGADALILSTTQLPRRWFQKPLVEVTAAHPEEAEHWDSPEKLAEVFPHRKLAMKADQGSGYSGTASASAKRTGAAPRSHLQSQSAPMRKLTQHISHPATLAEERMLRLAGFSKESVNEYIRKIVVDFNHDDRSDPAVLTKERMRFFGAGARTLGPDVFEHRRTWALVGNAGSGKTSTAVKLALQGRSQGKSVLLVAADRRKLCAADELASYAEMIGVRYAHVSEGAREHGGFTIVDTTGLDTVAESSRSDFEQDLRDTSVALVLDGTIRFREMLTQVEAAMSLGPVGLIFTRLENVREPGVLHELLKVTKLPLLCFSESAHFSKALSFPESAEFARVMNRIVTTHASGSRRHEESSL